MKELRGKVAVITGAGSGIGRALALACAKEGMSVALADIDEPGMAETVRLLEPSNAAVLTQRCNVAESTEVESLAAAAWKRFGATHLVFNNAGVGVAGPMWTTTLNDWEWTLGINLMGVVHGVRSFVPRMLEAKLEGRIVNTASAAGLTSVPGSSVYCVTKHAVVTMSECLAHELDLVEASLGVSVLCPAFVPTGIADSQRNRPSALGERNPLAAKYEEFTRKAVQAGRLSADDVARITLEGVRAGRFYILPHPKIKNAVETRMRDILDDRAPTNVVREFIKA
jgi:NAD(P)-dependent dehydrogenase (short-subunit alcohol dehydrogenase family)